MHCLPKTEYDGLTDAIHGAILSFQLLDFTICGDKLKQCVTEILPTATLIFSNMQKMHGLNSAIQKFMDRNGWNFQLHPFQRIIWTLTHSLYEEADECAAVIETPILLPLPLNRSRRPNCQQPCHYPSCSLAYPVESRQDLGQNVTVRFKDRGLKFSSALRKCRV